MARRVLGALVVAGAATLAWSLAEAHAFTLRRVTVPCCRRARAPLRILHLSDLHLTPGQRDKIAWVRALGVEPVDLVVTTGDNLAHALAVPPLLGAYEPLMRHPGLFVFGSNDYFGPRPKNPLAYFGGPSLVHREPHELPVEDLRAGLVGRWLDGRQQRARVAHGQRRDDSRHGTRRPPHRARRNARRTAPSARTSPSAWCTRRTVAHCRRSLTTARISSSRVTLTAGQVCVPGYGALVTNCDLDTCARQGPEHAGPTPTGLVARLGWAGHQSVRAGAARVPSRGDHPDARRRVDGDFLCGPPTRYPRQAQLGVWRSLVARVVRDDEVAGSNPVTPTSE